MSNNYSRVNKIAGNTIMLYIQMGITMFISLFSSRIILQALGVDDFGLYNVVGGVVALLSFLRSSLTSSTQRFLSYEMGKKQNQKLNNVFSMCLTTHILIAIIILILAESLGLWFLNTQIRIPEDRIFAANWIYQFSVLSLCLSVITVPYSADVISHEKMFFYAVVHVVESILKLGVAFIVMYVYVDKLILYGGFMLCISIVTFLFYYVCCRLKFYETHYHYFFDKKMFFKIFSFSGWTIVGQVAVIGATQGTSILINIFHSVVANAAMGIAQQVNSAVVSLTSNFQTAFQPQITKSYASKDYAYLNSLIFYSSKISFFLLFIVSLPIILNINSILEIWLVNVPLYTNVFCVFILIASIMNALSSPLMFAIFATGKIKKYQIIISIVYLSDLLFVYLLFKIGMAPYVALAVKASINFIMVFIRMGYANKELECFSFGNYWKNVIIPCFGSAILMLFLVIPIILFIQSKIYIFIASVVIFFISLIVGYFLGLNHIERVSLTKLIVQFVDKIKKK